MRAVTVREFGTPESLSIEEVASPEPGPDEILIDVRAVGVNFVDLLVIGGTYQFLPPRPFTPGKLPAGIVAKVGANVSRFSVGDRVLTTAEQGGYAERATALADHSYRIPDAMSFTDAAAMALAFDTAWFALRERGRLRKGESVLVLGATGSVGLAAVQLAKAFGAHVLAGVSSMAKADVAKAAGADEVIDLSVENLRDGLRTQVHAVTGGKGADVVIDSLGDRFFAAAFRALAWSGRLVVVGFAAGEIPTVKVNYLLVKNIEVSGLQVSDYRKRTPALMRECFEEIFALYEKGLVKPPDTSVRPLQEFAGALAEIRDRKAKSRIVLSN
ncbi:NADPH:quinone oxidoreductase family protein [Bradyrhizobium sp. CCGB12]|uniref:NADPH:quinone oxidoreductase family protein n=1 Tax=Bradyrhizobium sp. CCGB12 TaxID=2949632 RepID=UPI0020B42785|nr:NADPH:quinone oxidoreductase family protein [Bradyrhizobium sp. CCGB12]MCP3387776.1 NADPH:quinone oxidoreductase family protein [Bradyrhizobium sp. CCGB12]